MLISLLSLFFSLTSAHASGPCTEWLISDSEPRQTILKLIREGAYDIPVDESGFVVAANVGNHAGNYGRFWWFRDFARVYEGLVAHLELLKKVRASLQTDEFDGKIADLEAKVRLVALAMMRGMGNSQWTHAAKASLNGEYYPIWIRRLIDPFKGGREPTLDELEEESRWAHKQNDALASFAMAIMDAFKRGHLKADDFTPPARENFSLLAAYFVRIRYYEFWDAGAWEELLGRRSSSIGLVTRFLERFVSGEMREIAIDVIDASEIREAIAKGYEVLQEQLFSGDRLWEAKLAQPFGTRAEDGAILHLTWSWLERWGMEERERILKGLEVLERPWGHLRYHDDWFLYGSAEAARNAERLGLLDRLAIPDGVGGLKIATREDLERIVALHDRHREDKNMSPVILFAGRGLDAGWGLFDAMKASAFAELGLREEALRYFARDAALFTRPGQLTIEGTPVTPYRKPEALLPVQVEFDGKFQTLYYVSPNQPLNWATAESAIAANRIWDLL